jgi:hypothetical protein
LISLRRRSISTYYLSSSSASMDQVPVELTLKILSQACFDDKATGCALSLTSKEIRGLLKTVRFEAVSLYGPVQVNGFASVLEHSYSDHPYLIEHLFVSGSNLKEEKEWQVKRNTRTWKLAIQYKLISSRGEVGSPDDIPDINNLHLFEEWMRTQAEREAKQRALDKALSKLIARLAPSLKTFFITSILESKSPLSFICPLPQLTDLSVTSTGGQFELPYRFPKLRRIHTTTGMRSFSDKSSVDFEKNAPALAELRLTNLTENNVWLLSALVWYAGHRSGEKKEQALLLPKTMKRVILQQCSPPYGSPCGNSYMQHRAFSQALSSVASAFVGSRKAPFELKLLQMLDLHFWIKGKSNGLGYFFEDARRDWADVIFGEGKGCWDDKYAMPL